MASILSEYKDFHLILWIILALAQQTNSASCPLGTVIEGSTYIFTATIDGYEIYWMHSSTSNSSIRYLALNCDLSGCYGGTGNIIGSFTYIGGGRYQATMMIGRVSRDIYATTWSWMWSDTKSNQQIRQCDLEVYSLIPTPVCNTVGINPDNTKVIWSCVVSKVYPEVKCQMEYKENNGAYVALKPTSLDTGTLAGKPPYYYNITCSMAVDLKHFTPGATYKYKVSIYRTGYPELTKTAESTEITLRTPELTRKMDDNQNVTIYNDAPQFTFHVPVYGYPQPSTFTLYKSVSGVRNPMDPKTYNMSYTPYINGIGSVEVVAEAERGHYVMTIGNGVGNGLNVNFYVDIIETGSQGQSLETPVITPTPGPSTTSTSAITPRPGPSISAITPTPGPSTSAITPTPGPSTSAITPTSGPSTSSTAATRSAKKRKIPSNSENTSLKIAKNVDEFHELRLRYLKEEHDIKMQIHKNELQLQQEQHKVQMEILQFQREHAINQLHGSSCSENFTDMLQFNN